MNSEDTTVVRLYEIIRTHGEGLVEVLTTVPAAEVEATFKRYCNIARRMNQRGRFSYRRLPA